MAKQKKKRRAKYMQRHRKEERELIRIGKHFLLKHPKLVVKELGSLPKLTIKPRPIRIPQPSLPTPFSESKKKRKKRGR